MNNRMTFPIRKDIRSLLEERGSGTLLGILLVFVPFGFVASVGEGLETGSAISYGLITLAYVLGLAIATLVLRQWGWNWRAIGLARPASWGRTALQAVGATLVSLAILVALQVMVQIFLGPTAPVSDQSEYNPISGNLPLLLGMLAAAWTTAAFGEEMLFRAFMINALGRPFQQTRVTVALTVVGSSVIFGLAHFAWGWMGVLETTLFGLVLGTIYVRSGRNLWVTIIAHGLANTAKFLLLYSGAV
jgi:membrane protease YdiL (CAAX protease family)